MKKFTIFITLACVVMITPMAFAQNWQPAGDNWIAKWWGLDLVTDTGGFDKSALIDYLAEGSGGFISNASVSTPRWCWKDSECCCEPSRQRWRARFFNC